MPRFLSNSFLLCLRDKTNTDFLDKASIIRLTISFLKLRQFSVNGHPPWAPDFTTLGSINPYSSLSLSNYAEHYSASPDERPISASNASGNKHRVTPAPTPSSASVVGASSTNNNQQTAGYNSNLNNNDQQQQVLIGAQSRPPSLGQNNQAADRRPQAAPSMPSSVAFPVVDPYRQQQQQLDPAACHQDGSLLSERNLSKSSKYRNSKILNSK